MRTLSCLGGFLALLCCAAPALAVEVSTNVYDFSDPGNAAWNYVGSIGGASGEFLGTFDGESWVITATHVGGGAFTLGGVTYQEVAGSAVTIDNSDGSPSDITLFRISTAPSLTNLTIAGSELSYGSTIEMIGNGGGKSWADNTVSGYANYTLMGYTINGIGLVTLQSTGGQVVSGDSGGGEFYDDAGTWVLVGLISGAGDIKSGGTDLGQGSIGVDISSYATQIVDVVDPVNPVPEIPWAGLGTGAATLGLALLGRRRWVLSGIRPAGLF